MNSKKEASTDKKEFLEEDPNLKRWFQNKGKRSVITADVDLRKLIFFCRKIKKTPAKFASLDKEEMENITADFLSELEDSVNPKTKAKYAPTYVAGYLTAVKSWAEWNRKKFERKINISNSNARPSLEEERVPTPEELRRVLYADTTPLRTRVEISFGAFSGLRPEAQGDYLGLDALRLKDLPELEIEKEDGKKISFLKIPTIVTVRDNLSKARHQYLTFLPEEGCEILKAYLEKRISSGEKLSANSPVVSSSVSQAERQQRLGLHVDVSPVLTTSAIEHEVRKAMRLSDLPWRPYVFRSYFDTNLMHAESKGLVTHSYQQFWMGHKGDIEATYTVRKKHLPPEMLEDMRTKYAKIADQFLQTRKAAPVADFAKILREQLLLAAGVSQEQLDRLNLSEMKQEDFQKILRERLTGLALNNGNKQKVVKITDLDSLIEQGFEFVSQIPGDRAIVKVPSI